MSAAGNDTIRAICEQPNLITLKSSLTLREGANGRSGHLELQSQKIHPFCRPENARSMCQQVPNRAQWFQASATVNAQALGSLLELGTVSVCERRITLVQTTNEYDMGALHLSSDAWRDMHDILTIY